MTELFLTALAAAFLTRLYFNLWWQVFAQHQC